MNSAQQQIKNSPHQQLQNAAHVSFYGILLFYFISSFFPDSFLWGVNHLAYFSLPIRIGFLALVMLFTLPLFGGRAITFSEKIVENISIQRTQMIFISILIGIIGMFIFYFFRIGTDIYGDSRAILKYGPMRDFTIKDVVTMTSTEPLSFLLHQNLSRLLHIELQQAYQFVSALCGGIFLFLFIRFVLSLKESPLLKITLTIIGISCGSHLLFFGHVENYTLVYLCLWILFMLSWKFFDGSKNLTEIIIVFIAGVLFHIEMILVFPALFYLILYSLQSRFIFLRKILQPRFIIAGIMFSMLIGLYAYIFIFKAFDYGNAAGEEIAKKIFLPFISNVPPPHFYTLYSLKHLSDIVQVYFFTLPISGIFFLVFGIFFRKAFFTEPKTMFLFLASLYFFFFDVTVNPLLTPMRDWDFLGLASVPVTFVSFALLQKFFLAVKQYDIQKKIIPLAIAPVFFSVVLFYVNADKEKASERITNVGIWAYNSYYWGSSYIINVGLRGIEDINKRTAERIRIITTLLPPQPTTDVELSVMYEGLAYNYIQQNDYQKAMDAFAVALDFHHENTRALRAYADVCMLAFEYESAAKLYEIYNSIVNQPTITDAKAMEYEKIAAMVSRLWQKMDERGREMLKQKIGKVEMQIPKEMR
ncbi:MAG: hypothetical protein AAB071_03410, partial [Bacteroidota bacterium]